VTLLNPRSSDLSTKKAQQTRLENLKDRISKRRAL